MADSEPQPLPTLVPVAKPITLIPVGLKEAGLDSPTFRATVHHFGEQIDVVEKWLENYIKAAGRVANEVTSLEALINTYLSWATPPQALSEAVLDHDYTLLALKRYNEGAKEFWMAIIRWMKKVETSVIDPIRAFLKADVANLKSARRNLEHQQRTVDGLISRYSSNSKTKESSSLREDAFQLHEARKAYLKASMDYSVLAPQVRNALDKLLVKIFSDRWKDMKNSRDALASSFGKWSGDIDRIRGWSKEMENNERVFKRELEMARTQIENAAEANVRPPRELDDYAVSTVPYIGSSAPIAKETEEKANRQGWLFQRTSSGRPARTVWVRRWFYINNGILGYLTNNIRTGAVEESEKIGVLLCGVRPAFNEERRFCFEVKTKDTTVVLQAETQGDLTQWISTFEVAKRKALENPASTEAIAAGSTSVDPAFAITPPVAPEFAAKNGDQEEAPPERSNTLGLEPAVVRSSTDVSSRRALGGERDGESSRDHAARIISKLKSDKGPSSSQSGGIAGLIAASHHGLALGAGGSPPQLAPNSLLNISTDFKAILGNYLPVSSLAPSTLANPPAPTNLSKTAVVVSGERRLGLGTTATDGGMPSGLMANIWGSANWGFANRFERGDAKKPIERRRSVSQPPSPILGLTPIDMGPSESMPDLMPLTHRKTISMGEDPGRQPIRSAVTLDDYPNYYPLTLKAQDAQFRMIFPDVSRDDKLVLVFRAAWTATDQHEFPGRVYITMNDIHFYSNHFGLVLVSSIGLDTIHEITAAPGKDCDFLFVHLKPGITTDGTTRVTIKTFLEPLRMLQRRLTYLLRNVEADEPASLEEVIRALLRLEHDESPSMGGESWEDISPNTPTDGMIRRDYDNRVPLRIDGTLYPTNSASKNATKFRLPVQPVVYVPQGMSSPTIFKEFDITAKALFHVLAGDKSAVFQMLNCENGAERLVQSPWVQPEQGHHRREFRYQVVNGGKRFDVADHQLIDVFNDHLCYVITDRRTPWSLPSPHKFSLMTKIVITHAAKSRCRLSIYTRVDWRKDPLFGKGLIEKQALADLKLYATSLTAILIDQVTRLGTQANNSRKAVQIFGQVGVQTQSSHVSTTDLPESRSGERIRTYTIVSLTRSALQRVALQGLFTILGLIVQIIQSTAKVVTAHTFLVGLLASSAFTNMYFANRDTWSWWRERNARLFMAKIGVHPNAVMGRSVWLKDLDEFISLTARNQTEVGSLESPCATQFNALVSQTDPSALPVIETRFTPSQFPHTQSTIRRLQRSRQHIGSYRHDLLVALRTIRKVEQEILKAEWESWVWSEATNCKHAVQVLKTNNETDGLREWWNNYCGSCLKEMERLE